MIVRSLLLLLLPFAVVCESEYVFGEATTLVEDGDNFNYSISMNGFKPNKNDYYVCKVFRAPKGYIKSLTTTSHADRVHHIILETCAEPMADELGTFDCMAMSVCKGNSRIIYAWARNAPPFHMPDGVAYSIGEEAEATNWLVLQVHYAQPFLGDFADASTVTLEMTTQPPENIAAMLLFMGMKSIPAGQQEFYMQETCQYEGDVDIHPFAYRTHTHGLGRLVSAYYVHDGEWTQIGKRNPQWPQMFVRVNQTLTVRKGDWLSSICRYDSSDLNHTTHVGATGHDEMCNFYTMYYRKFGTPDPMGSGPGYCAAYDNQLSLEARKIADEYPAEGKALLPVDKEMEAHAHQSTQQFGHKSANNSKQLAATKPHGRFRRQLFGGDGRSSRRRGDLAMDVGSHGRADYDSEPRRPAYDDDYYDDAAPPTDDYYDQPRHRGRGRGRNRGGGGGGRGGRRRKTSTSTAVPTTTQAANAVNLAAATGVKQEHCPTCMVLKESITSVAGLKFGQISGLAVSPTTQYLYVFHRGNRVWDDGTFELNNRLKEHVAVNVNAVVVIDYAGDKPKLVTSWGKNMFYMPHGIHVDNAGAVFVTDVGLHQVIKFKPTQSGQPAEEFRLGVKFTPGRDVRSFCKPTAVATLSDGSFFVADGYCNSRVVKFSADGKYVSDFGRMQMQQTPPMDVFLLPHDLSVDNAKSLLFVSDRGNGRVTTFDLAGKPQWQVKPSDGFNTVYSADNAAGHLYMIPGEPSITNSSASIRIYAVDVNTHMKEFSFAPTGARKFSRPHVLRTSHDGSSVFVGEVSTSAGGGRLWRFKTSHAQHTAQLQTNHEHKKMAMATEAPKAAAGTTSAAPAVSTGMRSSPLRFGTIIITAILMPVLLVCIFCSYWRSRRANGKRGGRKFDLSAPFGRPLLDRNGFKRLNTEDVDNFTESDSDMEDTLYTGNAAK